MGFAEYTNELADPQQPLAVSKLTNLSGLGPEETSLFLNAWLEMELSRRQRLLQELIDLVEDNVELNFDAVFFVALADRDPGLRRDAVRGLWEYEGRDLIDALLGLLDADPNAAVRAEAALALGRFDLQAELDSLRADDAARVERALRETFEDEAEPVEVRGRALESLGVRSEPWVAGLIRAAADSGDRRLRLSALHAMGRSCDAAWLPELLDELKSDDAEARYEAVVAAGQIGEEEAAADVIPLTEDEDVEVRQAAVVALGEIGGDEARDVLQQLAAEGDESLREAAIEALAEIEFADDPLGAKLRE